MKLLVSTFQVAVTLAVLVSCVGLIGFPAAWMAHLAWRLIVLGWGLGG